MAINYIPLDKNLHQSLKVNLKHNFEHAKEAHIAAATLREFAQLASCMPIVFIKEPNTGSIHSVAMLGLEQNQNSFFYDGKWQGHYVPLNIQRYPFDVRKDGDKLGVFFDENASVIGEQGELLFTEAGEPSEYLKNRQQLLGDLANSEIATQKFIKEIQDLDLLVPLQMLVNYTDGQKRNVTGVYTLNEKKVNELDEQTVARLHKSGYLAAMYTVLLSLGQMNRLVQLSSHSDKPIQNLQLRPEAPADEAQAAQ